MFQTIAEHIYFHLSKKKLLNQEDRDVYTYALEVVLLNVSLLLTLLIISLLMGQLLFFVCYICFFVPLRIFSGGYHAKKSEICFPMSVISYIIVMFITKFNLYLYENIILQGIAIGIMLMLFAFAPVENRNHPLDKYQKHRNRMMVRFIVLIDFTLLLIFCVNRMSVASYEIVFVVFNGVLFLIGKLENYMLCRK